MLGLNNSLTLQLTPQTEAQQLVSAFQARIITDGGNSESRTCLEAQLTILSNIE